MRSSSFCCRLFCCCNSRWNKAESILCFAILSRWVVEDVLPLLISSDQTIWISHNHPIVPPLIVSVPCLEQANLMEFLLEYHPFSLFLWLLPLFFDFYLPFHDGNNKWSGNEEGAVVNRWVWWDEDWHYVLCDIQYKSTIMSLSPLTSLPLFVLVVCLCLRLFIFLTN